jgi:hypothetical protein
VPSPLKSPQLRRILVAYTVNRLGTWIGLVALLVTVFDHTHSGLAVAALLFAWEALPAFVVPAVVARVEASRRRGELSRLYLFEAAATASIAVLLWHFSLPAVLLLAALDGTAALAASALLRAEVARAARDHVEASVGDPAAVERLGQDGRGSVSLQESVHEAEREANAALNVAFSVTFVLGPVLGGAVVAAAGAPAALFIDVGSFIVCGALLIDLHPHVEDVGAASVRSRLRTAWRHINEVPSLRGVLLAEALALVFFTSQGPIGVPYAKATLHAGDRGFGLIMTVWGVGVALGSVVFARSLRRELGTMLSLGTLAVGLSYIGFAAAPSLLPACLPALVGGIGNGVQWASLISVVQRLTPQHLHGRLMGAVESLGALCLAVGLGLGGILVALSSPRVAFLVVGLGAVATTTAFLRLGLGATSKARDEEWAHASEHAGATPPREPRPH